MLRLNLNTNDVQAENCGFYYGGFFVYDTMPDGQVQIFNDFNQDSGDVEGDALITLNGADAAISWIDEFNELHAG